MSFSQKYSMIFSKDLYKCAHQSRLLCRDVVYRRVLKVAEVVGLIEPSMLEINQFNIYKSSRCYKFTEPCIVGVVTGTALAVLSFESNDKLVSTVIEIKSQQEISVPRNCALQIFSAEPDLVTEYRIYGVFPQISNVSSSVKPAIILHDSGVIVETGKSLVDVKFRKCIVTQQINRLSNFERPEFNSRAHDYISFVCERGEELQWERRISTLTY